MTATEKAKAIQIILGVNDDGVLGFKSHAAFEALAEAAIAELAKREPAQNGWMKTKFSSFADPADIRAFEKCKAAGKSDIACFAVGDNGIGQFGKITAQEDVPMVAIHSVDMVAKWGSEKGAAHKLVNVRVNGHLFQARCEDRISKKGRVDINPACAKLVELKPPFLVEGEWSWA